MNKADLLNLVMRSAGSDRVAEIFPQLVEEVENRLNERIRLRELLASAGVTINADGIGSLPADMARVRFVTERGNPQRVLDEVSEREVLAQVPGFALGSGIIRVYPARDVTVHYWKRVASLKDNNTNVVLDHSFAVYHTGIMAAYEAMNGDIQKAAAMWAAFDQLVTAINANEDWHLHGQQAII